MIFIFGTPTYLLQEGLLVEMGVRRWIHSLKIIPFCLFLPKYLVLQRCAAKRLSRFQCENRAREELAAP
jgi:hypothetical protein